MCGSSSTHACVISLPSLQRAARRVFCVTGSGTAFTLGVKTNTGVREPASSQKRERENERPLLFLPLPLFVPGSHQLPSLSFPPPLFAIPLSAVFSRTRCFRPFFAPDSFLHLPPSLLPRYDRCVTPRSGTPPTFDPPGLAQSRFYWCLGGRDRLGDKRPSTPREPRHKSAPPQPAVISKPHYPPPPLHPLLRSCVLITLP